MWRRMRGKVYPSKEAKQGTGPRSMVWVLVLSVTLAVIAGILVYSAFYT